MLILDPSAIDILIPYWVINAQFRIPSALTEGHCPAHGAGDGGDVAMGPGSAHGEDVLRAGDGDAALEQGLDPAGDVRREPREVGECLLLLEAPALWSGHSDEDCGPALAVWDGFEKEGHGTRISCMWGLNWRKIGFALNVHVMRTPKRASGEP